MTTLLSISNSHCPLPIVPRCLSTATAGNHLLVCHTSAAKPLQLRQQHVAAFLQGYGVIGTGTAGPREVESAPAFSITLAALPNTQLSLAHVSPASLPDGDAPPGEWQQLLGPPAGDEANTSFVVLAEPTFARLEELLAGLDFAYPEANVLGGLASAGGWPAPCHWCVHALLNYYTSMVGNCSCDSLLLIVLAMLAVHRPTITNIALAKGPGRCRRPPDAACAYATSGTSAPRARVSCTLFSKQPLLVHHPCSPSWCITPAAPPGASPLQPH